MVGFRECTQIDWYRRGRLTSNLREGDPKLETLSSLELAGTYICGSIDESNSWRLPFVYQQKRGWGFWVDYFRTWQRCRQWKSLDGGWCLGFRLQQLAERNVAQYPIYHRIEAGEPTVSQHNCATLVQRSDKECQILNFPSRKSDRQIQWLSDDRAWHSIY